MRTVEIAVALFTLALGALVAVASYRLGARWGADGPQAGYFPFYIGLIICIGSVANLWRALAADASARQRVFADFDALLRVAAVLGPAALYVGGIYAVGIYVSSAIYITIFMAWIGRYAWHKGLAVGFGVATALFLMFEVWFKVPLPKGAYNMLGFLGY